MVLEGEPQGTEYNRLCLDCWRDRRGRDISALEEEATVAQGSAGEEESSSGSSSTSGDEKVIEA